MDEHPFTSYFDVHQGYKVLTHCHIYTIYTRYTSIPTGQVRMCISDRDLPAATSALAEFRAAGGNRGIGEK